MTTMAYTPFLYVMTSACFEDGDNQPHGAESFLRSWQSLSQSGNFLPFMEPEGSLPCTQQPATGPYPEPDEFSPHLPTLFL
jgi:hypothetical protein